MKGFGMQGWMRLTGLLAAALLLASCGGSGPGAAGGGGGTSVSTLSAFPVRYGQLTTVTISGNALDQNIQLEPGDNCSDLTRVAGGSEISQSFTCRMGRVGEYNMRVKDANGRQLATLLVVVPAPQVTLTTNRGVIVVELDVPSAPASANNFLAYSSGATPFFRNTLFHRAEAGVSISGGAYTNGSGNLPSLKPNTTPAIVLESNNGLKNQRGTLAMQAEPAGSLTARNIFLINLRDNPAYDRVSDSQPGTAVFGRVVSGMDIADAIGGVPVRPFLDPAGGYVPVEPVTITAISQTR